MDNSYNSYYINCNNIVTIVCHQIKNYIMSNNLFGWLMDQVFTL